VREAPPVARIELPPGDGPEVVRALSMRPELAHAVATYDQAVWNSKLGWRLHELVRMRVAQINECAVCLAWRTPEAADAGVTDDLLSQVDRYDAVGAYSEAEKVAIEYAERFCTDSARIDDGLMRRLREHFDDGEVVELTLVIAKYSAFGRFMQVLDLDQACAVPLDNRSAKK
jgi:AhpD family alkylhydroperoxidase